MWRVREWLLVFSPRRWSYAWRRSRHVAGPPILYLPASRYGSMILAEERALSPAGWLHGLDGVLASTTTTMPPDPDEPYDPELDEPFRWLPAPDPLPMWGTVASGWREQVADGLSPAALDEDENPWPGIALAAAGLIVADAMAIEDSGPEPSSLAPGLDAGLRDGVNHSPQWWAHRKVPGGPGGALTAAWPDQERLADTADITDARLLADVQADMRAREDGCLAFLAGFASACERVRLDLSASLA